MIQTANLASVPVFLQSEIMEGMITNDLNALRIQTNDVASAVIDGADVFILSHETSASKYPVEATVLLAKSIAEAENIYDHEQAY